jgi:hypothetical protein
MLLSATASKTYLLSKLLVCMRTLESLTPACQDVRTTKKGGGGTLGSVSY